MLAEFPHDDVGPALAAATGHADERQPYNEDRVPGVGKVSLNT